MKFSKAVIAASILSAMCSMTAFAAGTWQVGSAPNEAKWWYDNGNGTQAKNNWHWLDANKDGIAECYYFDVEGFLVVDTTTPDGSIVNERGEWVKDGVIQTKAAINTKEEIPAEATAELDTGVQDTTGLAAEVVQSTENTLAGEYVPVGRITEDGTQDIVVADEVPTGNITIKVLDDRRIQIEYKNGAKAETYIKSGDIYTPLSGKIFHFFTELSVQGEEVVGNIETIKWSDGKVVNNKYVFSK